MGRESQAGCSPLLVVLTGRDPSGQGAEGVARAVGESKIPDGSDERGIFGKGVLRI